MKKIIFTCFFMLLALAFSSASQAQGETKVQPQPPIAPKLQKTGFQFVLVVSHKTQDVVFANEDLAKREFNFGEMRCSSRLQERIDPVYPSQTLGSLILDCKHGSFPLQVSVTCSLLDPAAQSHFEFGEGDMKFSFDLLCKAKSR